MLRVVAGLAVLAFTIFTVVDCIQTSEDRVKHLPKLVWVAIILLFPLAGGAAWWIIGRTERPALPEPRRRPRPQGPDDDPDFLRGL